MAYHLDALVSTRDALEGARALFPAMVVCPLPQAFVLVPIPDSLAGADVEALCAIASMHAPVVHVSAEFFGGIGVQAATVWREGRVVSQLADTPDAPSSWPDSPISRALRHVGVVAAEGQDEFDALGLGRHRHTEDWK